MSSGETTAPPEVRRGWGLAGRVTAIVVGSLVPLILVLALSYAQAANQRREAEIANAAVVGQTVAAVVEGFARDIEGTTLAAAFALGRDGVTPSQAAAGPYLETILREYPVLRTIFVADLSGRVVAAQRGEGIGQNVSSRPYFATLRGGAETVWTPGIVGTQSGDVTVAFGRVIRGPTGAPVGYLIAAYYPPALVERLSINAPPDADITFYDANGLLLSSTARPDLSIAARDASASSNLGAARAGRVVRIDGQTALYAGEARYGTLVPVSRIGWVIGFTRPLAPLEAQLRLQLLQQLGGVTLVMLLVAGAVSLLARRLIHPVTTLAAIAAAIARGERPAVPRFDADPDVGQLAAGMAAMSQAVAEREDALQDLFAQQEEARRAAERASERTRRLQEITGQLSRSLEADKVLGTVARSAAELIDAPVGAVFLHDAPDEDFELVAAHGVEESIAERLRLPRHASLAGRAIDERRTLVVDDVRETPGTALPRLLTGQTAGSEMAAPILAGDQGLGVVKVFSPRVHRFAPEDAELLTALAAAAAVALTNARLYREVRDAVEARDEFLSVAAHELKTPITALKGISQLIARAQERGQLVPERLTRLTAMMTGASDRLSTLVEDLLDVSRIQSGQLALRRAEVDLVELVRQIVANRAETVEGNHSIETSLPASCRLLADPDRLAQVLDNLVDNAIKYSPAGGAVAVALALKDGHAELSVRDQGIGLPPGAEAAIFEPFGRAANATERALPGMGLGLYICRNIVERHGGRIWAESQGEDTGTTVHVELPLADPASPAAVAGPAPTRPL